MFVIIVQVLMILFICAIIGKLILKIFNFSIRTVIVGVPTLLILGTLGNLLYNPHAETILLIIGISFGALITIILLFREIIKRGEKEGNEDEI